MIDVTAKTNLALCTNKKVLGKLLRSKRKMAKFVPVSEQFLQAFAFLKLCKHLQIFFTSF